MPSRQEPTGCVTQRFGFVLPRLVCFCLQLPFLKLEKPIVSSTKVHANLVKTNLKHTSKLVRKTNVQLQANIGETSWKTNFHTCQKNKCSASNICTYKCMQVALPRIAYTQYVNLHATQEHKDVRNVVRSKGRLTLYSRAVYKLLLANQL